MNIELTHNKKHVWKGAHVKFVTLHSIFGGRAIYESESFGKFLENSIVFSNFSGVG